jgi:multicomponent Na+:H+ antiporter subunit G
MSWIASILVVAGSVLLVIAAWGVIALPDALARQHAATKAGTLALAMVCIGAAVAAGDWDWSWRLLLIIGFLMATLPVASHLLARAAVRESRAIQHVTDARLVGDDPAQRSQASDKL